jgi:hypothetical protein
MLQIAFTGKKSLIMTDDPRIIKQILALPKYEIKGMLKVDGEITDLIVEVEGLPDIG